MTLFSFTFKMCLVLFVVSIVLFIYPAFSHADQCIAGTLYTDDNKPVLDSEGNEIACTSGAQGESLFGCNKQGAQAMSVGSISALSSNYVPVDDAAVRLNTGFITFKECFADGVWRNMGESLTAQNMASGLMTLLTGRDGQPFFPVNRDADLLARGDEVFSHILQNGLFSTLNPAFRDDVTRAIARDYMGRTRIPNMALNCSYNEKTATIWSSLLSTTMNPACTPVGAFMLARSLSDSIIAREQENLNFQLLTGGGLYNMEEYNPATGRYETRTPGSILAGNVQQLITSGFRQQENVTEIDQIVGALFSGLSTHIIKDSNGLLGIIQSGGGQPSYLDRLIVESTDKFQDSVSKLSINVIKDAIRREEDYVDSMTSIASPLLEDAIKEFKEAEDVCWTQILDKVCAPNPGLSASTCTAAGGGQLTINKTIKPESQDVVKKLTEIAQGVIQNIEAGEKALDILKDIKKKVESKNTTKDEKRAAIAQLESLVAQNVIHSTADVNDAKAYKKDLEASIKELKEDTLKEWTTGNGWCNPANAQQWAERWKN